MSIFHTLKRKLRSCRRLQDGVSAPTYTSEVDAGYFPSYLYGGWEGYSEVENLPLGIRLCRVENMGNFERPDLNGLHLCNADDELTITISERQFHFFLTALRLAAAREGASGLQLHQWLCGLQAGEKRLKSMCRTDHSHRLPSHMSRGTWDSHPMSSCRSNSLSNTISQTPESSSDCCDKHRMDDCGRGRESSATAMGERA